MDELEQDARIALLQHYSSKASNEAIIIVTMAIAFFGFVQSLSYVKNPICLTVIYETFFLGIIVNVTFRSIGRLLRYGYLADSVLTVVISRQDISCLKRLDEECKNNVNWNEDHPKSNGYRLLKRIYAMSNINSKKGWACIFLIFIVIGILTWLANGKLL